MAQTPPQAIDLGRSVLSTEPERAVRLAMDHLEREPEAPAAQLLLAAAQRRCGAIADAEPMLSALASRTPGAWGPWYELGVTLAIRGAADDAVAALRRATALNPRNAFALAALADQLDLSGGDGADDIIARAHRVRAQIGLADLARTGDPAGPDWPARLARGGLDANDPVSACLLVRAALDLGLPSRAEELADTFAERWPGYAPLRLTRAIARLAQSLGPAALAELEALNAAHGSISVRCALAEALVQVRDDRRALGVLLSLSNEQPSRVRVWIALGHVYKTLGESAEAVRAYRRAIDLSPDCAEAYVSLANLKRAVFDDHDRATMRARLAQPEHPNRVRADFHFALAKALEEAGDFGASFEHYTRGAALRYADEPHDARAHTAFVARSEAVFSPAFFSARRGQGCADPSPIFVVGLPRSGSTLVEQILACHPDVEGCDELPILPRIAAEAVRRCGGRAADYPAGLERLRPADLAALGARYLALASAYRRLGRERFVDKLPGNVLHLGLIALILPEARIVDVRREPEACCVSLFRQAFAAGQGYSYNLEDLGRYYRDYLRIMDHMDAALPRPPVRVRYEALVADPEPEIRRLLSALGLDFHPACLHPEVSDRPVRTASADQVRRPITAAGVDSWRAFRPWLAPLYAGLRAPD